MTWLDTDTEEDQTMNAEQELKLLRLVHDVANLLESADTKRTTADNQILTHLSRINSTLSAIDRNLTLLEMKK